MIILSIETSCDETAISIVGAKGGFKNPNFKIIADTVISQVNLHKKYGGVYPALAKREHIKNLLPILKETLKKSKLTGVGPLSFDENKVKKILDREPELAEELIKFTKENSLPKIDAVAVTYGPGLEPSLWTGLNFAKALALIWGKPFIPVNHMEGHIFASLLEGEKIKFPALSLLISGGHTELVLMKPARHRKTESHSVVAGGGWMKYKTIGQTRDDAVGEAYDKVARMLDLPYPGGPQISALAESARIDAEKTQRNADSKKRTDNISFPRPMINSNDFDFSFSGLKTAVLYTVKNIKKLTPKIKKEISKEFENAVVDVLLSKTKKAIQKNKVRTLILGGGVTANKKIRKEFKKLAKELDIKVLIPNPKHSTDNAVMIATAGYFRYLDKKYLDPNKTSKIKAEGNLRL